MSTSLRHLGKYELREPLGRGNVGEVWKGYDTQHHRDVAIKILHTDLQSDPHFLTRFTTDGQEMTLLHHSNIVQVHEVNVSRTEQSNEILAYLAMDYIEGLTLSDYLQQTSHKGTFPSIAQIVYLFTSIGVAIDYAHQKGIVHGNIKPGNILLNKRNTTQFSAGEPMLSDCGFTRFLNHTGSTLSSPHYMSPEQARGEPPNNRSDVYALGVILYEICTGVLPFRDESSVAVMMQHINTLPTPPILINPNIPPALSEVILRAMAKDTATRFPMASLLAAAIADACSIQKSSSITLGPATTARIEQPTYTTGPLPESILGVAQPGPVEMPRPPAAPILPAASNLSNLPAASNTRPVPVTPMPIITGKLSLPGISGKLPRVTGPMPANPLVTNKLPAITLTGKMVVPSSTLTGKMPVPPALPPLPPLSTPATISPASPSPIASKPSVIQQASPALISAHSQRAEPALTSAQLTTPIKIERRPTRFIETPLYVVIGVLLLVLLLVGSAIGALIINSRPTTPVVSNQVTSNVYFEDDALGHSDTLRLQMANVAAPPEGESYYAWLQDSKQNITALGQMPAPQNGTITFTYPGNAQHTNLLLITQSIFVTLENTDSNPQQPGGNKVYEATLDAPYFAAVKDILTNTPELPGNQSVVVALFEAIKSINDKAGSIVDSLQGTHDYGLAKRQATRIIELVDGTNNARSIGDLPANVPSQLGTRIGLLSSPNQRGYIDLLSLYVNQVKQNAGKDAALLQHIQNVENAITDLQDWVQKMRTYSVYILKAAALTDPAIIGVALQLKKAAADSYIGRTIPPNNGPMPVLGSAGAEQAYTESQYMATLTLQKS